MIEGPCPCPDCVSFRIAVWAVVAILLAIIVAGIASAEPTVVCAKIQLPGKDHALNPQDPPKQWVQERVTVCETIDLPAKRNRLAPITDYKRDDRAVA